MLTVALVLVAGTGLVGSLTPSEPPRIPESAFVPLQPPQATPLQQPDQTASGDPALAAAEAPSAAASPSPTPGPSLTPVAHERPGVGLGATEPPTPKPTPKPTPALGTPRQILTGTATWYNNGTTAMRLPRGTLVKICGSHACVVRRTGDWGPAPWTHHIADLTPQDFRTVCGCGPGTGVIHVKISVY